MAWALSVTPASSQREPGPLTVAVAAERFGYLFDRADKDGDARLSREEMFNVGRLHRPAPEDGGMPGVDPRIWGHFDADRDGYVSRLEALERVRAMFAEVDADADGAVSYLERQQAQENAFRAGCTGTATCVALGSLRPDSATSDGGAGLERFSPSTRASFRFNSGLQQARYEAIQDPGSWERLWNGITARAGPAPLFPRVDFEREMILLAAMGQRATGGHSIEIASAVPQGSELVVTVIRTAPGRRCGTTQAVSQPADLVKVPATSRPIQWRFEDLVTQCP